MGLDELEIYQIARKLSKISWNIYIGINGEHKYSIGKQFLRAVDSIGANIAEGFGRFYYLDSTRFYYNARGSLWESYHWINLLKERALVSVKTYSDFCLDLNLLGKKLNQFISRTKSLK